MNAAARRATTTRVAAERPVAEEAARAERVGDGREVDLDAGTREGRGRSGWPPRASARHRPAG